MIPLFRVIFFNTLQGTFSQNYDLQDRGYAFILAVYVSVALYFDLSYGHSGFIAGTIGHHQSGSTQRQETI